MSEKTSRIKNMIATQLVKRNSKKHVFDEGYLERYMLPKDAPKLHNNSFYFTGHSTNENVFLARLAFRGAGDVEVWFALKIPGRGLFNYEEIIDKPGQGVSSGPLKFECIRPSKEWGITFNGELKQGEEIVKIDFQGKFFSDLPLFVFNSDMNPKPLAKSIASEKWNRDFFTQLREGSQVHYEQCGEFVGEYVLEGKATKLKMLSIRDHSFGPRDWGLMRRHIWLIIALDDKTYVNFSLVRYPALKEILAGFYMTSDEIITVLEGTSLLDLGEDGQVPSKFKFEALLENGETIKAECSFDESLTWVLSDVYRITEGIADFTVNGTKGKGIAEFGYYIPEFGER